LGYVPVRRTIEQLVAQYRKLQAAIQDTFDSVVTEIRKAYLLSNIRDDMINSLIGLNRMDR
jgi:hypothetical protein